MVRDRSMQADVAEQDRAPVSVTSLTPASTLAAPTGPCLVTPPPPTGAQTLLRGLAVLDAVGNGVRSLKALGERLGTTRSTTHRLVSTLVVERYLRVSAGQYFLGPRVLELGFQAREQIPLAALARPYLDRLGALTGDTIHLGVREGDDVLYIEKIAGRQGLQMRSRVGQRMPIALTGIGKALILDDSPTQWEALFRGVAGRDTHTDTRDDWDTDGPLRYRQAGRHASDEAATATGSTAAATASRAGRVEPDDALARLATAWHPGGERIAPPHVRPAVGDLLARMHDYAAGGYAFDLEDNEPSIRCVAAPIRDAGQGIVAALSVSSTTPYMPLERMAALRGIVIDIAQAISMELGYPMKR